MKILIVSESLELGGAARGAIEIANALAEKSIETYLTAPSARFLDMLDAKVKFFDIPKYKLSKINKTIAGLLNVISITKPDIVYSFGATIAILSGIAVKKSNLLTCNIFSHHSSKFSRIPSFLAVYLIKRYCDKVIAITKDRYNSMVAAGIDANKICVIENFVDVESIVKKTKFVDKRKICEELGISRDAYIISMAGRLVPGKKFDKFIKIVFECSKRSQKKFVGLIIGEGRYKKSLKKLANTLSGKASILFLGYQKDVYKFLSISDIFLFPSEYPWEVLPIVLIESLAAGIPIVCSDISANRNVVINNENGFLVKPKDDKYCDCIFNILNNKNLASRLSENGVKIARSKFDKTVIIDKYILLFNELLKHE